MTIRNQKKFKLLFLVFLIFFIGIVSQIGLLNLGYAQPFSSELSLISSKNYQSIDFILDDELDSYGKYGFFPQRYKPSLQATIPLILIILNFKRLI